MTDDPGLSSVEITTLFGPEGRVRAFLEIEAVLAEAQGELGVIPVDSGQAVASVCRALDLDASSLLQQGWEEGSPIIPLLDLIRSGLEGHTEFLHWESTTQDIVDTALMWRSAQAIGVLIRDLVAAGDHLAQLARTHRHAWMTGRTFLQAARPTTFGAKAAMWLAAVTGRLHHLNSARDGLRVQAGGAVGTGTGMAGRSSEVSSLMADVLGLTVGPVSWQADREPVVSLSATVASVARTCEKIASDLMALAQSEVAEISMRTGGSTAMSHKANPVDAMRSMTAARLAVAAATGLLAATPPRLERDAGAWQAEWPLMGQVFDGSAVAVQSMNRALATIEVDESRMEENLDQSLGGDRPEISEIDRVVDLAIASFEEIRSDLVSGR